MGRTVSAATGFRRHLKGYGWPGFLPAVFFEEIDEWEGTGRLWRMWISLMVWNGQRCDNIMNEHSIIRGR